MQASAAKKIYEAKGRPSDNPLIVHIADVSALRNLTDEVPGKAVKLAKAFWPGPLTMIVKKSAAVPYETTGGMDTVAVRMPNLSLIHISMTGAFVNLRNRCNTSFPFNFGNIISVSYTHLDVYKRQESNLRQPDSCCEERGLAVWLWKYVLCGISQSISNRGTF